MFRFAYSKEFLHWALQVRGAWGGGRRAAAGAAAAHARCCCCRHRRLRLRVSCCGSHAACGPDPPAIAAPRCPAPQPPGFRAAWHCGVRVSSTGKLVAFISGIPASVRVNGNTLKTVGLRLQGGAGGVARTVPCSVATSCAWLAGCAAEAAVLAMLS